MAILGLHPDAFGPRPFASFQLHRLDDADEDGTGEEASEDHAGNGSLHDFVLRL